MAISEPKLRIFYERDKYGYWVYEDRGDGSEMTRIAGPLKNKKDIRKAVDTYYSRQAKQDATIEVATDELMRSLNAT